MKKIIIFFATLFVVFFVAGCVEENPSVKSDQFTIIVTDIDGETLGSKTFNKDDYTSVWDALSKNFEVKYYESEYGKSITSIENSVVDTNWYVSILENGMYSQTGVDGLVIDKDDVFEFRVDCWNTVASGYGILDEYDVLVDKTLYHYAKKYMKAAIDATNDYTKVSIWDHLIANLMLNNKYDENLFKIAKNEELITNLESVDLETLDKANFGKYYLCAKAQGIDLTAYKQALEKWVNEKMPESYEMYISCFYLMPIKALGIESPKLQTLTSSPLTTYLEYGPDDLVWQFLGQGLFVDYEYSDIEHAFVKQDWDNGCSTAELLEIYALLGINPRDKEYEVEGKDVLEVLFDKYYDSSLNIVKYLPTDDTINYSTNQIYLALASYKVARDLKVKVNIFA